MNINTENLVSITEANQNFSKVARLVDEKGTAIILKNNMPRYIIMQFGIAEHAIANDSEVDKIAADVLHEYAAAFEELGLDD